MLIPVISALRKLMSEDSKFNASLVYNEFKDRKIPKERLEPFFPSLSPIIFRVMHKTLYINPLKKSQYIDFLSLWDLVCLKRSKGHSNVRNYTNKASPL